MIAVALSSSWLFIRQVYIDPIANRKRNEAVKDQMKEYLDEANSYLSRVKSDDSATDEHKAEAQRIVEELERVQLERIASRMKVFAVD